MARQRTVKRIKPTVPTTWEDPSLYPQEAAGARPVVMQPPAVKFVGLWSLVAVVASVLTILATQLPEGFVRSSVALIVAGLVQPVLEWMILRRYLPSLPLLTWWAYNIVGLILGALLLMLAGVVFIMVGLQFGNSQTTGEALASVSSGPVGVIFTGALVGLATAGARWVLLRQYFRASPVLFFAGTMLGLITSGFLGPLGAVVFESGSLGAELAGSVIGALVSGALTGAGVLSLFRGHAMEAPA